VRVLILTHSFVDRDARIRRQIDAFADAGWDVEVLALDRPAGPRVRAWRVPMERRRGTLPRYVWEYGLFFLAGIGWVAWRAWRRQPPDLVYVNSLPDFLVFVGLPARLRGIPVVLDIHDPMPELFAAKGRSSRFLRRLLEAQERASVRFADAVITVHEPLRDLLARRSPEARFDVVMNVPDVSAWNQVARRERSRILVFNGSIAVRYGLDDLLRAMAEVSDRIPGLRLRLIGEGEGIPDLRALAASLGIEDRLDVVGHVPWADIPTYLADAWAGVNVPKPDELGELSFSNKVVEWVAWGLPVIAARTRTLLRYFPEGTLWYTTPGDPEAIAETLLTLHEADPGEVERRLERARDSLDRIAWPVQRQRLLDVAARLTDEADPPTDR